VSLSQRKVLNHIRFGDARVVLWIKKVIKKSGASGKLLCSHNLLFQKPLAKEENTYAGPPMFDRRRTRTSFGTEDPELNLFGTEDPELNLFGTEDPEPNLFGTEDPEPNLQESLSRSHRGSQECVRARLRKPTGVNQLLSLSYTPEPLPSLVFLSLPAFKHKLKVFATSAIPASILV
jgi:hypothetical protein